MDQMARPSEISGNRLLPTDSPDEPNFLLPRNSAAYRHTGATESREDIDYRGYRKFVADDKLVFPTASQPQR